MLDEGSINQLKDSLRLGITNQYGEKVFLKNLEIKDEWESMIVFPGYFNSIGCSRLYYKNREIKTKDKYYTPYRTYLLPVGGIENTIVTQCVTNDSIYLKIIGTSNDLDIIEDQIREDYRLDNDLTDKEIIEANRKDLEKHKRVKTVEVKFNESPEQLDKYGQVITNLDHYDNFFYEMETTESITYSIYNAERSRRWLMNQLNYLEEKYQYHKEKLDMKKALRALSLMDDIDINYIDKKTGNEIIKNMDFIQFETGRSPGEIWQVWRYLTLWNIQETIVIITKELQRLDL